MKKKLVSHMAEQLKSLDMEQQRLTNGHIEVDIYFYNSLCDLSIIRSYISEPLAMSASAKEFANRLDSVLSCTQIETTEPISARLLLGEVLISSEGQMWLMSAANMINNKPKQVNVETTVLGPTLSLTENSTASMNLIRQRYPSSSLFIVEKSVGMISKTKLSIVYDQELVKDHVLQQIIQQIEGIKADIVQSVGQLEALISHHKFSLFPLMLITERPDRIALNLAQGKVIILMEGCHFALIAPAVFFDFMSAMDDIYQTYIVSHMIVLLRYVALLLTITLPALYIAIVSYNPEIFRVQLTISIAGSRAAVPYPSFIEVLIMLFFIEALIEASIRLPKTIGPSATTVGGLILGQAAQQAGLISSIMIVIISTVAIANFVIPINSMSFAIRIIKYPFIILAIFLGITGVIAGVYCFILYLANMRSFGEPYFRLFIGENSSSGYKEGI